MISGVPSCPCGSPCTAERGKQVISEVSRRVKMGRGTPERGKASHSSGAGKCPPLPRAQAASAIELFTGVNKAGICVHTRTSRARTIAHFPPFVLYLLKKERGDTMSEPNIQIREAADCMQHWRKNCGEWVSKIWKRVSECRRPGMNI